MAGSTTFSSCSLGSSLTHADSLPSSLCQGEHNANLGLLAVHLCFSQDLLPQLWASLGGSNGGDGGSAGVPSTAQQPSMAQAALLELLGSEAHDVPQAEAGAADRCVGFATLQLRACQAAVRSQSAASSKPFSW